MQKEIKIHKVCLSQHFRIRKGAIKYIILHCSSECPQNMIEVLNKLGLSTHYIIGQDGKLFKTLDEENVAFHAGLSKWCNSLDNSLNEFSIGIEIEAPTLGQLDGEYNKKVLYRLRKLLEYLCEKYKIKKENILAHSDIAPTRKPDVGRAFPWQKLAKTKHLLWYNKNKRVCETDEKKLLEIIGYDVSCLDACRYQFCRHFLTGEIDIDMDISNLVNNPYVKNFKPKDWKRYIKTLQAVAFSFVEARKS